MIAWQRYLPYAFLTAAVFTVYSNVFGNAFLFDDDLLIHLNTLLRDWDTFPKLFTASTTEGAHIAGGFYRPIQNLLYFFIFQIGGEVPFGFHLLNVGLHAANACLGYRMALRLGIDARAALLAMLLWALHPLHTEAITYMSGTADPLFVFFCLWALNIIFPEATLRKIWISLPLFLLAILSKETAVIFPALVMVCLYYVSPEKFKLKTYALVWPLWLLAIAYLGWRVNSTSFDGPARYAHLFSMPEYATLRMYTDDPVMRVATFFATLPAYADLLVWPVGLHMERLFTIYDQWATPVTVGLLILLAASAQLVWGHGKRGLALSFGLLWFGIAHAPNAGILFPMNSLFLEHWMYLPTIGLFLGVAQTGIVILDRYKNMTLDYIALGLVLAVICAMSARTYDQNEVWHTPITFYNYTFSYGVVSPRAHNNLAIAYMDQHDIPDAINQYQLALREGDTYAETHYNLALALLSNDNSNQASHVQDAIAELQRSLEIEPRFYRSDLALSQIYAHLGDQAKADAYEKKAKDILGE